MCEDMRRQQMEKLGFQSNRTPGRLLLSLYNMHLDQWLRYFPCRQILIVKPSSEQTGEPGGLSEVESICRFLDIPAKECADAAAQERKAEYHGPEAESGDPLARSVFGGHYFSKRPMHEFTRHLLTQFFEDHWHAKWSFDMGQMDKATGAATEECAEGH